MSIKLAKPPYEKEALQTSLGQLDKNIAILKAEIDKLEADKRERERLIAQHEVYEQAKAQLGE